MVSERPQNQTGRWRTAHMDDCCLLDSLLHTLPVRRPLEILGTLGTCDKGPLLCWGREREREREMKQKEEHINGWEKEEGENAHTELTPWGVHLRDHETLQRGSLVSSWDTGRTERQHTSLQWTNFTRNLVAITAHSSHDCVTIFSPVTWPLDHTHHSHVTNSSHTSLLSDRVYLPLQKVWWLGPGRQTACLCHLPCWVWGGTWAQHHLCRVKRRRKAVEEQGVTRGEGRKERRRVGRERRMGGRYS